MDGGLDPAIIVCRKLVEAMKYLCALLFHWLWSSVAPAAARATVRWVALTKRLSRTRRPIDGRNGDESKQKSLWNFVAADHPVVLGVVFDHLGTVEGLPHESFVFLANWSEREREKGKKGEIDYCWE